MHIPKGLTLSKQFVICTVEFFSLKNRVDYHISSHQQSEQQMEGLATIDNVYLPLCSVP